MFRIAAAAVIGAAVIAATVGVGSPSPEQSAAFTFLHDLRADGVNVNRVVCSTVQDHPEHPVRQVGGNALCSVSLAHDDPKFREIVPTGVGSSDRIVEVPTLIFEDGSYTIPYPDDRP